MSMDSCKVCGTLVDTDDYPEGYYREDEDGKVIEEGIFRCQNCNERDTERQPSEEKCKRKYVLSEQGKQKLIERMRKMHADPEFKARTSERMRKMHADPEFKARTSERMRKMNADPEFKARTSERMRKMHADPEFKARERVRKSERMRKMNADPEFKARTSERMRKMNADPEFKARTSERMRKMNADPEFNPLAALTPEQREEYDVLVKKGGYKRSEALSMVLGDRTTIKDSEAINRSNRIGVPGDALDTP